MVTRRTGSRPRRLTRKVKTLPPSASVPSKSKAATVARSGGRCPFDVSSVERSATSAGTSCETLGPREGLPAADDGPAAAGLVARRGLFAQPPLLQRAHAVRAQADLGE